MAVDDGGIDIDMRAGPHFLDLLANDLVLRELTPFLDLRSLCSLGASCKMAREILARPGAVHYLDLTSSSLHAILKCLFIMSVKSSLRVLILDNCTVDDTLLASLFLDFRLRHLSLRKSYGWTLAQLCEILQRYYINPLPVCAASLVAQEAIRAKAVAELSTSPAASSVASSVPQADLSNSFGSIASSFTVDYDMPDMEYQSFNNSEIDYAATVDAPQCCTPMCARRPTITSIALLGGPMFPTDSASTTAPIFQVIAREARVETDLVPCEAHHTDALQVPVGWFLAEQNPSRPCSSCGNCSQKLCLRCSMLRTCSGCQKSWCTNCDPSASKARLDCYDCGPTCDGVFISLAIL